MAMSFSPDEEGHQTLEARGIESEIIDDLYCRKCGSDYNKSLDLIEDLKMGRIFGMSSYSRNLLRDELAESLYSVFSRNKMVLKVTTAAEVIEYCFSHNSQRKAHLNDLLKGIGLVWREKEIDDDFLDGHYNVSVCLVDLLKE